MMSKIVDANKKIKKAVVSGYQKVEETLKKSQEINDKYVK